MIDLPDTASPLYEKVKDYILTNIGTGRWGKDRKLPSENELVVSLGYRATLRSKPVAGRTPGTVTLRNDFHRPAPSIAAAS